MRPVKVERWTVDEIDDGVVRVLWAELIDDADLPVAAARSSEDAVAASDRVRESAIRIEGASTDRWTPEEEAHHELDALTAFLVHGVRESGAPGLPVRAELREGDVYWLVVPDGMGDLRARVEALEDPEAAASLARSSIATGIEVWDVTAAARQSAKRLVAEAMVARPSERPNPEQRPPEASSG